MITLTPAPDPRDLGMPAAVWEQYCRADAKTQVQILRASAAWIAAPYPLQAIGGSS